MYSFGETNRIVGGFEERRGVSSNKEKKLRIKSRPSSVKVRGEKLNVGPAKPAEKKRKGAPKKPFGSMKKNLIVDDQSQKNFMYQQYRHRSNRPNSRQRKS